MCIWRTGVNFSCLPALSSTLCCEDRFLWIQVACLSREPWESTCLPILPPSPSDGTIVPGFSHGLWASKLRALHSQGRAIAPSLSMLPRHPSKNQLTLCPHIQNIKQNHHISSFSLHLESQISLCSIFLDSGNKRLWLPIKSANHAH